MHKAKALFKILLDEIENNKELNAKVAELFAEKTKDKKRANKRNAAIFDPVELQTKGNDFLIQELNKLSIEELKDIVAEYGMDIGKLVMKWKIKDKIIKHIADISEKRNKKGDSFRQMYYMLRLKKEDVLIKRELLYGFDALERKRYTIKSTIPLISLHSDYKFDDVKDNDVSIYLISDESEETKEFIKKYSFEKIDKMPNNTFHILGNFGSTVISLQRYSN